MGSAPLTHPTFLRGTRQTARKNVITSATMPRSALNVRNYYLTNARDTRLARPGAIHDFTTIMRQHEDHGGDAQSCLLLEPGRDRGRDHYISNAAGDAAVFGNHGASGYFVIQNYGTIASSAADGVYLSPGGTLTNAAAGAISGNRGVGAYGAFAGAVVNAGSIAGTGNKGVGVVLNAGGTVSNGASASITGFEGVFVLGSVGTVANSGSIGGTELGIYLFSGGTVTNAVSASADGYSDGVLISVVAGTVANHGSIAGTGANGIGVQLNSGGLATNAASASITGVFDGVAMSASGSVANYGAGSGPPAAAATASC